MTQRDQVLRLLRQAGPAGVHSFELAGHAGLRAAARVAELRQAGHRIDSRPERLHGQARGCRYTLLPARSSTASTTPSTAPSTAPGPASALFDPPATLDRQYGDAA